MMVVVQQIVFTNNPDGWHRLAEALGLIAPYPPSDVWSEFDGDGILAVHHASEGYAPGRCDLTLIVDDLDAAATALASFSVERGEMEGVCPMLTVTTGEGLSVIVAQGEARPPQGDLAVEPIWFQRDIAEPRAILQALGFTTGIVADRGGWAQMRADGGAIGLHEGDPGIGASFRADGDLDALAERVREAGFEAAIIDEAYARTLRIEDPDAGTEVWINGPNEDLYGYSDESR
ncbi:MAG: hypothetical protein QM607_09995 [Microbacterium sp.]